MNQPILLIDISNSWTKVGLATPKRIRKIASVETSTLHSTHLKKWWRDLNPAHVMVASVVPKKTQLLLRSLPKKNVTLLNNDLPLPLKIDYPNPSSIGADRLANALAAISHYPLPAVVIDFGTAVTFDIISHDKKYLGGVIAPGLNAMTDYLHEKTALLPKINLRQPRCAIGKSTEEAMMVGAVIGYRGLIRGILHEIQKELKTKKITIIATGGQAQLISNTMHEVSEVNPLLTLEGLYAAYLHQNYSP